VILRLLSTLLLAGGVCFAQAEGKALQDLQKAFRASTAKKASPAELAALRRSAIAGIGSADNAKIAEALADAWLALETDAAAAETERQAANAELVKVDGQREVPKEVYDKIQALRPRLGELRKLTDELRGMQEDVQRHIGELHSADALGFLLDKVLTQKKDPMPLRLAAGRAVGSNGAAIMGRVQAALERVGLGHLAHTRARTLSGGEAQRVALARALVLQPDALLLDEPTANLDPYNVGLIEDLIRAHGEMTVVLVTHNVFQAKRLADRVGLLLNGQLIELAATDRFFNAPIDPRTRAFINGEMVY